MSIKEKVNELKIKLRFTQKSMFNAKLDEYNSRSKEVLLNETKFLKENNLNSTSDFSYGPDGPEQTMWESTVLLEDGSVYQKTDLNNHGKKSSSIELIIDGKYILIPYTDGVISDLRFESKANKFIETNISELPKDLAEKIQKTIQSATKSNEKTEEPEPGDNQ